MVKDTIEITRLKVFSRDNWRCVVCGNFIMNDSPQIAHRINNNKMYNRMYGKDVLNHPDNLVSVCSLSCNHAVSIFGKHKLIEDLVEKIREKILTENENL